MSSKPHHASNGRFVNPWPGGQIKGFADLLRWVLVERLRNPPPPDPDPASLPRTRPNLGKAQGDGQLAATWLGHSTVLLEIAGKTILTDPVWSDRASPFTSLGPKRWVPPQLPLASLPKLDLILLSHNHYDHCDRPTIEWLAAHQPEAPWVCPLKLSPLLKQFGVRQVQELDWWDEATVGGIKVTATPAQHFSSRNFWDRTKTLWCGYTIEFGNRRTYFAGDTAYHPEFGLLGERLGPFDLILMPIGAYEPRWFMMAVHCNPEDALAAVKDVTASHPGLPMPGVVPIHWGTYKLTDEPMDEPPRRFTELWRKAGFAPDRLWLLAQGESRLMGGSGEGGN
ncbi:MAG: MBL fold metallo-hydrolase [Gemmatimonadota bacterium]